MKTRTGHLFKREGVYYVQWRVNKKLFMRSTGKRNLKDAETRRAEIMAPFVAGDEITVLQNIAATIQGRKGELERLADQENPPLPLVDAWRSFIAAPGRPDSGDATLRQYQSQFSVFAEWIQKKHPEILTLRGVSPEIAGEFASHMTTNGRSPNTFNKYLNLLGLMFRVLKDRAKLEANPWETIQRKRMVTESRRELTTDELKLVCGSAAGELRLLFALGIYTGLRLGDCATLRWAEVDLKRRRIARIPNKIARRNPRPVMIPIHPVLHDLLSEMPPSSRRDMVLPALAKKYAHNRCDVTEIVQKHFGDCKIKTAGKGRGRVEVGFHSLRHTFVSLCREANAPLAVVEAIVGHSNPAMTRHYTHVSELAAGQAVFALPSLMGDQEAPPSPKVPDLAEIRTALDSMTPKTWQKVRKNLLARLPAQQERDRT